MTDVTPYLAFALGLIWMAYVNHKKEQKHLLTLRAHQELLRAYRKQLRDCILRPIAITEIEGLGVSVNVSSERRDYLYAIDALSENLLGKTE